ncbi:5'-methylthioadenosine nucleosidase / S-adenosylhomocysteine nucleosidase [Giardia duodenalis]|uniref:adenosylhomocysteine nucleosidase n=1 Tax=Giardia intestinalis TaxID=5741 RepID=V6TEX7_GIAIN|nr:5'-methylthioadenosine nucleosidase / S-adenosylhomocysteine nucleosidase [Giardia intestinalis]
MLVSKEARRTTPVFGVIIPMPTEFHAFKLQLGDKESYKEEVIAGRKYFTKLFEKYTLVLCECGIGKVCSGTAAVVLLDHFNADVIVAAGVAGGLKEGIAIGDVIVVDSVMQHDFNCYPFVPRHTIVNIGVDVMHADKALTTTLQGIAEEFLKKNYSTIVPPCVRETHGLSWPRLHVGCSISGDKFLENVDEKMELIKRIPAALVIEMEGGAVGQVCYEASKPFVSLRIVSDLCDGNGLDNYDAYCTHVASKVLYAILSSFFAQVA